MGIGAENRGARVIYVTPRLDEDDPTEGDGKTRLSLGNGLYASAIGGTFSQAQIDELEAEYGKTMSGPRENKPPQGPEQ
jgi:hypothetical protein